MTALESSVKAVRIAAAAADRLKATDEQAFDVSDLLGICLLYTSPSPRDRG